MKSTKEDLANAEIKGYLRAKKESEKIAIKCIRQAWRQGWNDALDQISEWIRLNADYSPKKKPDMVFGLVDCLDLRQKIKEIKHEKLS